MLIPTILISKLAAMSSRDACKASAFAGLWSVKRRELGVTGWVRNCNNGDVEVMATGGREQLNSLRQKLEQGPRASRVDHVGESKAQLLDAPSFRIEGVW